MRLTTTEITRAVGGELVGDDVEVVGAAIDSRTIEGGELFVPIVADRDGHEFIAAAVEAGAAAYLTNGPTIDGTTAIRVHDTGAALLDAGRLARARHSSNTNSEVIGITGSVGKTTVKDLTAAALASAKSVHASVRSFNNEMGVPLTLLNAPGDTDVVVVEMGARGKGHIALLCDIAQPTIGIITTVALAHAEMFGTVEDVAAAKGELVEALPDDGTAVLNGDHPLVAAMASRTSARVIKFGLDATGLDVTASDVELDDELRPSFHLHSPWGGTDVRLPVRGLHQVANALAAASGAMAAGATPDAVAAGLATATLSPWRMELQRTPSGALVLNDAYNANPTSMEAALRSLAALSAQRRVAVVGVMAELGVDGPAEHRRIATLGRELGIEMIAVNAPDYGVDAVALVAEIDEALIALGPLEAGDAVLVKGSRVAGLERLAARLVTTLR